MCCSRKPLDIEVSLRSFMRDKFLISRDESVNNLLTRCVEHVKLSCQMCVMCPHDPIACRLSRFDVVCVLHAPFASLFPSSFLEVSRRHVGGNRVSC